MRSTGCAVRRGSCVPNGDVQQKARRNMRRAFLFEGDQPGNRTVSTTWITPFDWLTFWMVI